MTKVHVSSMPDLTYIKYKIKFINLLQYSYLWIPNIQTGKFVKCMIEITNFYVWRQLQLKIATTNIPIMQYKLSSLTQYLNFNIIIYV